MLLVLKRTRSVLEIRWDTFISKRIKSKLQGAGRIKLPKLVPARCQLWTDWSTLVAGSPGYDSPQLELSPIVFSFLRLAYLPMLQYC